MTGTRANRRPGSLRRPPSRRRLNQLPQRLPSATGTTGTGPSVDHTEGTSTGHYIYIESSSPRHRGDSARLDSPVYPATTGSCATFWYSMNGNQIGTLNVYRKMGNVRVRLWTLTGNQGLQWRMAQVSVKALLSYQLTFEGVVGAGYKSDIALDDITIATGACPSPALATLNLDCVHGRIQILETTLTGREYRDLLVVLEQAQQMTTLSVHHTDLMSSLKPRLLESKVIRHGLYQLHSLMALASV